MPEIIGVRFGDAGKIYSFDPNGIKFHVGDKVIVETARGLEYATVDSANYHIPETEIKAPLKPVVRKATPEDDVRAAENAAKKKEAFDICRRKIEKHKLKMNLVDAEYTFDRSKVVFSFTADGRVDFRELVRDLAGEMRMRIELRQIYERDDIKLKGAMGMCGRPCCCIVHLPRNERATVKMAKNQNLSLNPAKVSGMCGKLMCCLKYENDYYVQAAKVIPKVGTTVRTADGVGRVVDIDMLRERVKVSTEKEDAILVEYYNVGEFETLGGAKPRRPMKAESADEDADELPSAAEGSEEI